MDLLKDQAPLQREEGRFRCLEPGECVCISVGVATWFPPEPESRSPSAQGARPLSFQPGFGALKLIPPQAPSPADEARFPVRLAREGGEQGFRWCWL